VLVTNDSEPHALGPAFERLRSQLGTRLHSLYWNGNTERTNSILGPHWRHVYGPETVVEIVGGVRLHYPPGAFGQSNLVLADVMAEHVAGMVPDGVRVLELYAGVGALGLPLARRAAKLDLNELNPDSLSGLERGLGELPPEIAARVRIHPGSAAECAKLIAEAQTVIVDPPRRGLDRPVLDALIAAPPAQLIYVSCGLDSFLEQTQELLASGRLSLEGLEVFVMFPYGDHVETVAWFRPAQAPTLAKD
jgi:tRNA/tmRNA/rRNA uracil-C5-methylase (TrmA/RlmC/RlmD family)